MPEMTFPVGRLVGGSLTKPRLLENDDRTPRMDKNTGKQMSEISFGVAIAKRPGVDWKEEPWGRAIVAEATSGWPNGETARHDFSWKIKDGDSAIPGKPQQMPNGQMQPGRAPKDVEGYPGHWVLFFSGQRPPQLLTMLEPSGQQLPQARHLKPEEMESLTRKGFFFQVFGSVKHNNPAKSPGVYLNHSGVCLLFFGTPITSGPDINNAQFGYGGAAPAGASTAPVGAMAAMPGAPVAAAPAPAPVPMSAPVPVVPNPAILNVPTPRQMTALANGATYEAFVANGWTDEAMRSAGFMV